MTETTPRNSSGEYTKLPLAERIRDWYRDLPDKKRYVELVTATLTIPVLLTVLWGNVVSLRERNDTPIAVSTPEQTKQVTPTQSHISENGSPTPTGTPAAQCLPGIGPMEISYPEEGSRISDDPVCMDIPRQGVNYCSVVWQYRINGSSWSNFTDREICMYGLSAGQKILELRVKSIVNGEEKLLKRSFTVSRAETPTPATQSAVLSQ